MEIVRLSEADLLLLLMMMMNLIEGLVPLLLLLRFVLRLRLKTQCIP